jgi:hypothetical protein
MSLVTTWAAVPMLTCSALMLGLERRRGGLELLYLVPLIPLAWIVVAPASASTLAPALTAALVVALLSRQRDDLLHGECALKLLWVLGSALALSWAGVALLAVTTGTTRLEEQWAAIAIEAEPALLWKTSLSLSLLGGLVLLGTAPFHFWVADVVQGVRPSLAAPCIAALQTCGSVWLAHRLDGIGGVPEAERVVSGLLDAGAAVALGIGAVTLSFQRRPERRVGTLASLNGALIVARFALEHGARRPLAGTLPAYETWSVHLALALCGACVLARFLPISDRARGAAPVMFRRHPVWESSGSMRWHPSPECLERRARSCGSPPAAPACRHRAPGSRCSSASPGSRRSPSWCDRCESPSACRATIPCRPVRCRRRRAGRWGSRARGSWRS